MKSRILKMMMMITKEEVDAILSLENDNGAIPESIWVNIQSLKDKFLKAKCKLVTGDNLNGNDVLIVFDELTMEYRKLSHGHWVRCENESQWLEILDLEGSYANPSKHAYLDIWWDGKELILDSGTPEKQLTFPEFKQRLINTLKL